MNAFVSFWNRLTTPSASVVERDQRRQAQFVSSILLSFLLVGIFVTVISLWLFAPPEQRVSLISGSIFTILVIVILYLLSRTKLYRYVIALTGIVFGILVLISTWGPQRAIDENVTIYLIVPVLLASVLASTRSTIWVAVVSVVSVLMIMIWVPVTLLNVVIGPLTFVVIVSTLLIVSARQRDLLEADRRADLEESEARFRTLLEATYEAVAIMQDNGIVEANVGFAKLFQCEPESVVGLTLESLVTWPAAEDGETIKLDRLQEAIGRRHNGTHFDLEIIVKQSTYKSTPAVVAAMRDITERKRTELALQQAQRLDSIGVLAGGIAHDFNNLLTGVIAQASLAQMRLDRKSAAYVHIEKSLLSAEQAAELTQQLLAYVGKGSLTTETFNLNQLITRNTPILKTSIPVRTELHINLADYACPVLGDRKQIQQILLNLVINAGQAIKNRRGHIEIRTERTTVTSQYKLSTFVGSENIMPGDYIALIVKDNGEGMDRETASRIFEPFFSTKPVKEGMGGHGLGLSTALGVIRAHGGAIGVISQPGAGTEFTMLLPVSLEALSGGELNSAENDTAIMSEKAPVILVIDDESAVRTAINDILEMKNIHVLTANDGIQGVRQFTLNAAEIDGVILDMKMPNMGGEEAFDAMRRIDPRAKIIVSSGYSEKETMKRFIKEENVYYLEKPFDIAKLMDTIDRVLADGDQPVNGVA